MIIVNTEKGEKIVKELEKKQRIYIEKQNIKDYFKYQQTKNFPLPLNYYEVINELSKKNSSLKKIHLKYIKLVIADSKIRQKLYPIYRVFKRK